MTLSRSLVVVAAVFMVTACAGTPMTTRTGQIHDVKFEEQMSPSDLVVQIGDEIRWVNHRTMPVRIDFLGSALDDVACERGFSNFIGMRRESATIQPNESASLCFSKAGMIKYNARIDSAAPGGKIIEPGTIQVGSPSK